MPEPIYHSCIDDAEEICYIATTAPIYNEQDYDAIVELLDEVDTRVMNTYLGGQNGAPDEWRLGWYETRQALRGIERARAKALLRFRGAKFFAGLARKEKAIAKDKKEIIENSWTDLKDYDEYMRLKQQGFDVRIIYTYPKNRYQMAQRREVKVVKNDAMSKLVKDGDAIVRRK